MQIAKYIGLAYDAEHFHCWHFFQKIQQEIFFRSIPDIAFNPNHLVSMSKTIKHEAAKDYWQKCTKPQHGCAVLLAKASQPIHVGCWLSVDQGGVIHNQEGIGVIFQKPADLRVNGWHIHGFYQPQFSQSTS